MPNSEKESRVMNKPLTVEQRRKVAGACIPDRDWRVWMWQPEHSLAHKDALISTVARMIKSKDLSLLVKRVNGMDDSAFDKEYAEVVRLYSALGIHIAENNTQEIELLAWELLEKS